MTRTDKEQPTSEPSPTFWPGTNDNRATGPIGDGTPHARMRWFWERMRPQEKVIEELTGWHRIRSDYRFEAAVADAFDSMAVERVGLVEQVRELETVCADYRCALQDVSRILGGLRGQGPLSADENERVKKAYLTAHNALEAS